jgi:hypothetical protein
VVAPDGVKTLITTSPGTVVVTEAPAGVVVAGWLFNTDVWSSGEVRATFENSQMTAAPVPLDEGVMVTVVAPDLEFAAYQMSIEPATGSAAKELPASAYRFPVLSVIPLTLGLTPGPEPHATTIRLPLPVAGIVHVDGKVCIPQEVTWTRLAAGKACVRLMPQLLEPPGPKNAGLHATPETCSGAIRLTVAVLELLPRVAVMVAL